LINRCSPTRGQYVNSKFQHHNAHLIALNYSIVLHGVADQTELFELSLVLRLELWSLLVTSNIYGNEKALGETQTLRAGCSKVKPKIFTPLQTPFPGTQDRQNLISWRWSLPSPIDPVWWRSMHAISSYRGNRPTNTRRPPVANTWL